MSEENRTEMAPFTPEYLDLNWRRRISKNDMLQLLDGFMTDFDSSSKMNIVSSTSTAKGLATPAESGKRFDMVLQKKISHVKTFKHSRGRSATAADKYIVRMAILIKTITNLVDSGTQIKFRDALYTLRPDGFNKSCVDKSLKDLALSIGVHPYQLGVVAEVQQSFVRVPSGSELVVEEVNNIFEFNLGQGVDLVTYPGGESRTIKSMYKSVKVRALETPVRAVVVTEQRSISEKVEKHRNSPGFEGILLVMTGGFPDAACREFLCLLAASDALDSVPFIWISDCDPHALSMYSVIKYGSANMAYASPSMVCAKLLFGGVTMPRFETFAHAYPDRRLSAECHRQSLSDEAKAKIVRSAKKLVEKTLTKLRAAATSQQGKSAKAVVRGAVKSGVFARASDELALEQLGRFEAGGQMLSLLRLDELDRTGVAFFIAEYVAAVRNEAYQNPAMFGDFSQVRAAWVSFAQLQSSAEIPSAEDVVVVAETATAEYDDMLQFV